ncbi:MAG: TauD/TfdA family dioxygenase [Pseudomonadota bacterium]
MKTSVTLVVSIDGVAPRFVTPGTMPTLCELARLGASTFDARTIDPSITLPAHASLFRGVAAIDHGIVSNDDHELKCSACSFLKQARTSGLQTAALFNWQRFCRVLEQDAVDHLFVLDGGYQPAEDEVTVTHACATLSSRSQDLVFAYIAQPDLAGHEYGWGSGEYLTALERSDGLLSKLWSLLQAHDSILVTTDHGGHGDDHQIACLENTQTFMAMCSPRLSANSLWPRASILDVAPTIADVCEFQADPLWQGKSLIGSERSLAEVLIGALQDMEHHAYGERVNMLEHALQAASAARAGGAEESIVLACLLHDVGHVMGPAGEWGLPDHAKVGALALQQHLPAEIVEPIRAHVDAKRFLVATEPEYFLTLSKASQESLKQQNGAMSDAECEDFKKNPFAAQAIALRRYDDFGKQVDQDQNQDTAELDDFRELLNACLNEAIHSDPKWFRDACRCSECRSKANDQHLLNTGDLEGWQLLERSYAGHANRAVLGNSAGTIHHCHIPESSLVGIDRKVLWDSAHGSTLKESSIAHEQDLGLFAQALDRYGIALIKGVSEEPGEVLRFASRIGYVRETNYGRLFDVIAEPDPINLAYTPVGLPLHTDNPYRNPCPTIQLLHCLSAAKTGGHNHFADGFHAAERLRRESPELFSILADTELMFRFHDKAVDLRDKKQMIQLDADGEICAIHVNHRSMEAPKLSAVQSRLFYAAYRRFTQLLSAPESLIELLLQPGELIAFDNRRVLHGRAGFKITERRHLQGCYIDADAVESTARMYASAVQAHSC